MDEVETFIFIDGEKGVKYKDLEEFAPEYGLEDANVLVTINGAVLIDYSVYVRDPKNTREVDAILKEHSKPMKRTIGNDYDVKIMKKIQL
ncbi:MAG: hypothetical protein GOV02_00290 [Candidatus Aenigmarchaeota archaeon]|nr:hypothetical protein [Candidatus Aenigmarchaeota archaeon]